MIRNNEKVALHYVTLTNPLSFLIFPKSGPTYRRQLVNPVPQTPQGQVWCSPVKYPRRESKREIKESECNMFSIQYSSRMSRGPAQKASNAESESCHDVYMRFLIIQCKPVKTWANSQKTHNNLSVRAASFINSNSAPSCTSTMSGPFY